MGDQKSKFEERTENTMAKKRKKTKYDGQKEKKDKIRCPKRERRLSMVDKPLHIKHKIEQQEHH